MDKSNEWLDVFDKDDLKLFLSELINASLSDGFSSVSPNNRQQQRMVIEKWWNKYTNEYCNI